MNKIKLVAVAAACFGAGLVALRAPDAGAAYRRMHHATCTAYYEGMTDMRHASYGLKVFGAYHGIVACPIPSDGYLPHSSVSVVNVHGYKNTLLSARVCSQTYYSTSYDCGNPKTGGTGHDYNETISDLSALDNTYGWPWVSVTLGYNSILYGYYVSGTP